MVSPVENNNLLILLFQTCDFLSSLEHKIRCLAACPSCSFPYSDLSRTLGFQVPKKHHNTTNVGSVFLMLYYMSSEAIQLDHVGTDKNFHELITLKHLFSTFKPAVSWSVTSDNRLWSIWFVIYSKNSQLLEHYLKCILWIPKKKIKGFRKITKKLWIINFIKWRWSVKYLLALGFYTMA